MDFGYGDDLGAFAAEVRAFLERHLTDAMRRDMHRTGTVHDHDLHRAVAERGWLAAAVPGTRATRDPVELAALFRELELADAPYHGMSTTMMVIGVLDQLGTPQLRTQVLPRLLAGDTIAVLGYSEPGSGSDVAAARTRAVPVDDGPSAWRITGQKMWTTLAQEAGYVLLLTRTDAERPKHLGLTMFLVPLDSAGITIQPVHTIADERTNVVFYDEVEVADSFRVGGVNEGWRVMAAALSLERGVMGGTAMIERLVGQAATWARTPEPDGRRPAADPAVQEAFARARIDAEVAHLLTQRTAWLGAAGESPALAGTIAKLFASTAYQRSAREFQDLAGPAGAVLGGAGGEIERAVRHAAVVTIQGGTTEVQRNQVAEQRLGLPKARPGTRSAARAEAAQP